MPVADVFGNLDECRVPLLVMPRGAAGAYPRGREHDGQSRGDLLFEFAQQKGAFFGASAPAVGQLRVPVLVPLENPLGISGCDDRQVESADFKPFRSAAGVVVEADQFVCRRLVFGDLSRRSAVQAIRHDPISECAGSGLRVRGLSGSARQFRAFGVCVPDGSGLARPDRDLLPGPWAERKVRDREGTFDGRLVQGSSSHVASFRGSDDGRAVQARLPGPRARANGESARGRRGPPVFQLPARSGSRLPPGLWAPSICRRSPHRRVSRQSRHARRWRSA